MIYLILGLSALFIGLSFVLTPNNARNLLAGYNTMSQSAQEQVDIISYVKFFKRFHWFLGLSLALIGSLLYFLLSSNAAGVFLAFYPILAYIYYIYRSQSFSRHSARRAVWIGIVPLVFVSIFLAVLFALAFKEDSMYISEEYIEIEGSYGEKIPHSEIASIQRIESLPSIVMKRNGYALGSIRKGYFTASNGQSVKLIVHAEQRTYLLINTRDGKRIYYAPKSISTDELWSQWSGLYPDLFQP